MNITNKAGQVFGLVNLITIFIVTMVGLSVMGPVAQEIKNMGCYSNSTSLFNNFVLEDTNKSPEGSTDSFGGGGNNRFGGYDNKVTHDPFINAIASTSMVKTDKSVLNPDCQQLSPSILFMIDNFTIIFILFNIIFVIIMYRSRMYAVGDL
jgi:hypothetical protein